MEPSQDVSRQVAPIAMVFEAAIVVLATLLAWLLERWPLPGVSAEAGGWETQLRAAGWGTLAALPMLAVVVLIQRSSAGPLRHLRRIVDEKIVPLVRQWTIAEMAVVSVAAGLGEEMLFRGLLQTALADGWRGEAGSFAALLAASAVFGICHWVTPGYAALAGVMGAYLGTLLLVSGNLLVPITAHALYDFLILIYLARSGSDNARSADDS